MNIMYILNKVGNYNAKQEQFICGFNLSAKSVFISTLVVLVFTKKTISMKTKIEQHSSRKN